MLLLVRICNVYVGDRPGNYEPHIRNYHPYEWNIMMDRCRQYCWEKEARNLHTRSRKSAHSESVVAKYPPQHDVQQLVTKRLAIFAGANNVPNSIVTNPDLISASMHSTPFM